jgi:hypothetical protein
MAAELLGEETSRSPESTANVQYGCASFPLQQPSKLRRGFAPSNVKFVDRGKIVDVYRVWVLARLAEASQYLFA